MKKAIDLVRDLSLMLDQHTLTAREGMYGKLNALLTELEAKQIEITGLTDALKNVVDACEDKGGQFRAWHNHLRNTTKAAKVVIAQIEDPYPTGSCPTCKGTGEVEDNGPKACPHCGGNGYLENINAPVI